MAWYIHVLLVLVAYFITIPALFGQDPPEKPKIKVELRWVERTHVEGLTAEKGFVKGYDPSKDTVYPHKKPALVLTKTEVSEARLHTQDYSKSGLGIKYMVELRLTEKARNDLADSFEGNEMRLLTVLADGKHWGLHRYEKDKSKESVPVQARAETFAPTVGYFSSKSEAQRLVDVFK